MASSPKPCPNEANHTPVPVGPHDWPGFSAWAEKMSKTHEQTRCPECGLWAIWTPR